MVRQGLSWQFVGPTLHIEDYGGVLCVIILEKSIGFQSGLQYLCKASIITFFASYCSVNLQVERSKSVASHLL